MEILRELNRRNHSTIVVSSHNLNHVVDLCTRIAIMHEGKIVHDMEKSEASLEKLKAYFRV
jgi:ABC-2 type transport system ATP-binding protein